MHPQSTDEEKILKSQPKEDIQKKVSSKKIGQKEVFVDVDGAPKIRGQILDVPIEDVKPNPWNYNQQSDFIFEKLGESLVTFGFTEPLTVRSSNENGKLKDDDGKPFYQIVGGEHRWKKAKSLGMKIIRVNDIGYMKDDDLRMFMIILNETKGRPNQDALSSIIADLSKRQVDLSVLPFEASELESLASLGDFDWNSVGAPTVSLSGKGKDDDESEETVSVMGTLALENIPPAVDAKLADRIIAFQTAVEMNMDAPWKCLDMLLDHFYEHSDVKEIDTAAALQNNAEEEEPEEEKPPVKLKKSKK